jgi:hypothetical protein
MKGPGLHRTPARRRLDETIEEKSYFFFEDFLAAFFAGDFFAAFFLAAMCDTSFSQKFGPDRFHWFGCFRVVVRRGLDRSCTHFLCNPTGFVADPHR